MSKLFKCLAGLLIVASNSPIADAQVWAQIRIDGEKAAVVGSFDDKMAVRQGWNDNELIFLDNYAGLNGLAKRVSRVSRMDDHRQSILLESISSSLYRDPGGFKIRIWTYDFNLAPLEGTIAAAHTSWISRDTGVIMPDDILPQRGGGIWAMIELGVPNGWNVYSTSNLSVDRGFVVSDVEKASFVLGKQLRVMKVGDLTVLTSGDWSFTDMELTAAVAGILKLYSGYLGMPPAAKNQIAVLHYPSDVPPGQWEADTRGSAITIVSSDAVFKSQSLNRLHEQLRHEMFHLWFPNGVNLSGNYDWFYEGFALYQSLKLGVAVNRIRFDDYLNTLSQAYAIDGLSSKRLSLIDASKDRFRGSSTAVYARGMLVAFLCDIAMLEASKTKRSSDDLVREIYKTHPLTGPRVDGNETILSAMTAAPELKPIADRYVTGAQPLDLSVGLASAGLELVRTGRDVSLRTVQKPNGRQKDILNKLGYNNWRRSSSK